MLALMSHNDRKTHGPTPNWFLIDQELSARDVVELAVANGPAAQSFGAKE